MEQPNDIEKKYDKLKKEFEDFTYIISHDVAAPLRHIRQFTQLLLSDISAELNEEQKEYESFLMKGVDSIENMMTSLLQCSRLTTKIQPFTPVDISEVIHKIQKNLDSTNTEWSIPKNLPTISCDGEQIELLFSCLIENAIKFQPDGNRPKVTIEYSDTEFEYLFTLSDNGIGISEHQHENIFILFKQLDPNNYDGQGMGLTYSKKIIESLSGKIWVESVLDNGSKFSFSIPKIKEENGR